MIKVILSWIDKILRPELYYKPYKPNTLGEYRKIGRKRKVSNSYRPSKNNLL